MENQKLYFTIYQTTNLINYKIYIGAHQTSDINDSYIGSGKHLKRAIKKYGRINFKKEVLFIFSCKEDMYCKERELVSEDFLLREDVYNFKKGGSGGNPGISGAFSGKKHSDITKKTISNKLTGVKLSSSRIANMKKNHWSIKDPEAQRIHAKKAASIPKSEEHKEKIRQALLLRGKGSHKKEKCPYCGLIGGERAMKRWHFDNCKSLRSCSS